MNSYSCDLCGKFKGLLNNTNWARHTEACKNKKRKLKHMQDISSFFSTNRENNRSDNKEPLPAVKEIENIDACVQSLQTDILEPRPAIEEIENIDACVQSLQTDILRCCPIH
ncbi:uncharacterized protein LOC132940945 [Metopolophium dirhodum]|uniref:uncharacterized protein LOC132940945 n=1 Tax=Metopolophium dirhodum TaxID=44670 RepID=UPI00298F9C77|nr:uncharacterized protein LOC132940945 [Metopolophium dirhodum]